MMTSRRSILAFLVAALSLETARAAPPSRADAPDPPATQPAEGGSKKVRRPRGLAFKALRTVIEDARFKEMTLEEFAEWIERKTGANVVVKWKVLEAAGVEPDAMINLKLKNVTIRKLLELAFKQVTVELEGVELAAKADDNTLIISTRKDLNSELVTRIYDVQALLIIVPNFAGQGMGDPTAGGRSRLSLTGSGRPGVGTDPDNEQRAKQLIDTITSSIEPDSWAVNGGKGTISYYKGRLVVRNNLEVHQLLGGAGPTQVKPSPQADSSAP